jgi:hypothetical protein
VHLQEHGKAAYEEVVERGGDTLVLRRPQRERSGYRADPGDRPIRVESAGCCTRETDMT